MQGLTWSARRILFGETADAHIEADLKFISRVDKAHLVMLAECGIVDRASVCKVIGEIDDLLASSFATLRGQVAPRGLYLLYENHLIQKLGAQTGGVLQTGRSRNDLNATVLRMRLREVYLVVLREALRLHAVLLRRSRRYLDVVMPAYTHYQAAVPITYGHYLAGVACALARDIEGLIRSGEDLNRCPLGAGAVGGTTLPINPARTASLLGFDMLSLSSIDSVASRDLILRLLASSTILGVTLSRISADLLLWTTSEFSFLMVPDNLVGSSSMMPQKRNVFLLEHIEGRSAAGLGAFVNSVTAMHGTPFTNSIAVGTEAVAPVWNALKSITESTILLRLVVAAAIPEPEAMYRAAVRGYTAATELANQLVKDAGMSFRTAHHIVGSLIRESIENGREDLQDVAARRQQLENVPISFDELDPASIARASTYGGGPGPASLDACLKSLHSGWVIHRRKKREQESRLRTAEAALDEAVRDLCSCAR